MISRTVSRLVKYSLQLTRESLSDAFVLEMDPEVGWKMARKCAEARIEFPLTLDERDRHVFMAYLGFLSPGRVGNPVLYDAFRLYSGEGSMVLKAMIIAGLSKKPEDHLRMVAKKMGLPYEVVAAFETLYFNVLDRSDEPLYLANIVYPESRLVTLNDDYFVRTPVADLLLRAGYDHQDIGLVEHLSGLRGNDFIKALMEKNEMAVRLEKAMFGNAGLITRVGRTNEKTAGLDRALQLLLRGRMIGGSQPLTPPPDYDMLGELDAAILFPTTEQSCPPEETISETTVPTHRPAMEPEKKFADGSTIQNYLNPRKGWWKNKHSDMPVIVIGIMRAPGKADHYLTEDKVGIPVLEVEFAT